jgi:hypothetical protein
VYGDTASPTIVLNYVARGEALKDRTNDRATFTQLNLIGWLRQPPQYDGFGGSVETVMAFVYDKMPTPAAVPTWTDVFVHADPWTLQRTDTRDRFEVIQILRKRTRHNVTATGNTSFPASNFADASTQQTIDLVIPLNHVTSWNTDVPAGGYANMTKGALLLMSCSNVPPAAAFTFKPLFQFEYQLQFRE